MDYGCRLNQIKAPSPPKESPVARKPGLGAVKTRAPFARKAGRTATRTSAYVMSKACHVIWVIDPIIDKRSRLSFFPARSKQKAGSAVCWAAVDRQD